MRHCDRGVTGIDKVRTAGQIDGSHRRVTGKVDRKCSVIDDIAARAVYNIGVDAAHVAYGHESRASCVNCERSVVNEVFT